MPDPKTFKDKDEWMGACMHQVSKVEGKPHEQSVAVCLDIWRNKDKKKSKKAAYDYLRDLATSIIYKYSEEEKDLTESKQGSWDEGPGRPLRYMLERNGLPVEGIDEAILNKKLYKHKYNGYFWGGVPDPGEPDIVLDLAANRSDKKTKLEITYYKNKAKTKDFELVDKVWKDVGYKGGKVDRLGSEESAKEPSEATFPDAKGFFDKDISKTTKANDNFRKVLYTAKNSQLVLMSLKPGEDIGVEVHTVDQFFRIEEGEGEAIINDSEYKIGDDSTVIVPAGAKHNFINTGKKDLKLYSIYSPPHHADGTIHETKADAIAAKEEFDGKTTE